MISGRVRLASDAWESLFRTQVAVMRRLRKDPVFSELSIGEYDVLFSLTKKDGAPMRLKELNDYILLTQPSLSRMVDRLEAKGLVVRTAAADDHRGVQLSLTDAGRALQRSIGLAHVRTVSRYVGAALDDDELRSLLVLTEKLRAAQSHFPDEETEQSD